MSQELPEETLAAIRKAGRKRYLLQVVKVLVFWALTITALFLIGNQNKLFNWKTQPISMGIALAALILFPIWKFKLLEPLLLPTYRGTVTKIDNKVILDGKDEDVKAWGSAKINDLTRVDSSTVVVTRENGRTDRFVCKRDTAAFARIYYRVGDPVFHPVFAKYPLACRRKTAHKFCIWCGGIGTSNETSCSACGIPFPGATEEAEQT